MTYTKKWIDSLAEYGVSQIDFDKEKVSLSKKFGKLALDGDVIWSCLEKLTLEESDIQKISNLHYTKALFLIEENRDPFLQLQENKRLNLIHWQKEDTIKKVEILSSNGCVNCKKLEGKIFTISEALDQMPIPNKNCSHHLNENDTYSFCRCCYLAYLDN